MRTALSDHHALLARASLGLVVLGYAALATLYAVEVPPWNAPDEPAHFNYARQIADRIQLPVLAPGDYSYEYLERLKAARFPSSMPVESVRYEGHQPPLYYVLGAATVKALAPLGTEAQLRGVRLLSVLLGLMALVVGYRAILRIFPGDQLLALGAAGVLAFIPMHVAASAAASNDALADLMLALIIYEGAGIVRQAERPGTRVADRSHLRLGLWLGLALLTKVTVYVGTVVALVAVVIGARRGGTSFVLQRALAVGTVSLLVSGWWFIRNVGVYGIGDPFGLRRHALVVAGQPTVGNVNADMLVDFAATTFRSFWGQFGWMGVLLDARVYAALAVYSLAGTLGLAVLLIGRRRVRLGQVAQHPALLLPVTLLLVAGAMLFYSASSFYQPQGRYLFPALPAIAVALVVGHRQLVPQRLAPATITVFVLALVVLDIAALYVYMVPDLRP